MNKAKQKIYTSIEIDENFADTGEAYIVGLAVTDSPASLGTDVLAFSAQKPDASPFKDRHYSETSMFTEALEAEITFEEVVETTSMFATLREKVSDLLGKSKDKEGKDAASFNALGELIEQIATHGAEQAEAFTAEKNAREKLQADHDKLSSDFNELVKRLGDTEDHSQPHRPPVTGGDGQVVAEY
ncbi:Phage capsid scaffolding protein (GPO) serine peptidase [compost metagenome]